MTNSRKTAIARRSLGSNVGKRLYRLGTLFWLSSGLLPFLEFSARAQFRQAATVQAPEPSTLKSSETGIAADQHLGQDPAGAISGTIVDETGALIAGAHIKLSQEGHPDQDAISNSDGQFSLRSSIPGPFQLTIMFEGFATQTYSGAVLWGENYAVPPITLTVAATVTNVRVSMSLEQIAEAEIKDQEKQRILGALPNFYVTYDPAAPPLTSQAANSFPGHGQGAQGYAKRFGAVYADSLTGTFIGSAILPSVFKQDPRYFYKGTGTVRFRILFALASSVICKGDNGRWQANYSAIVGGFTAAGLSNLYYPASDRSTSALTVENALIGIGSSAAANVLQEFLFRKLTPHAPNYARANP